MQSGGSDLLFRKALLHVQPPEPGLDSKACCYSKAGGRRPDLAPALRDGVIRMVQRWVPLAEIVAYIEGGPGGCRT